jgi:hypothetical protein
MEELESVETADDSVVNQPIFLYNVPLRFQNPQLILREFSQFVAVVAAVFTILGLFLGYISNHLVGINASSLLIFSYILIFIQHSLVYTNLLSNGWGTPKGKFWCEVKIMIARGFNTIRTSIRLLITPLLFTVMSVIISEINAGTSENLNQYDMQSNEKCIDSNQCLLLEYLNMYQKANNLKKIIWGPFCMSIIIQFVLLTALIICGSSIGSIPFIVIIYCVSQHILSGLHLLNVLTYVKLEIFRSLSELFFIIVSIVADNI